MSEGGKSKEIKGRLKKAGGSLTDDPDLKRQGRQDQREGKLQQAADKAKDAVRDAADAARR
jgi:uncharacterized protein YjbJ (UPF0337 family)